MKIDVITLFPDLFDGPLSTGLLGKAIASGAASVEFTDPRTFTSDVHRTVDDTPYGGGAGMVMKVEPLVAAIRAVRAKGAGPVVMMTPQGRPLAQADLSRWASGGHLALLAGRYEGFDERVRTYIDEEVSLGDFVLTGGEYAALAIVDGVVRLLPGTLGNADSFAHDSFAAGLLEHPQYTRPPSFEGRDVPDVLTSGHHERIESWRHAEALARTRARRPELLAARGVTEAERRALRRRLPYVDDPFAGGAAPSAPAVAFTGPRSSDALVALARVAVAYEVRRLIWVGGDAAQVAALPDVEVEIPDERPRRQRRGPAPTARVVMSRLVEVVEGWSAVEGTLYGSSSATGTAGPVDVADGVVAFGAPAEAVAGWLPPLRSTARLNRLPLVAAVAGQLERIVAEG